MFKPIFSACLIAAALSGCASIVKGTTQDIAVSTPEADGAVCELTNDHGKFTVTTPGNVKVHRSGTDLMALCSKGGYAVASEAFKPHFNGATMGNVLAGGLIGVAVDASTGANYSYDDSIVLAMHKN